MLYLDIGRRWGREWTRGGGGGCDDGSCRGAGLRDDVRGGPGGDGLGGSGR